MCKNTKNFDRKYTIQQFRSDFSDENACLDKIFMLRYGNLKACPSCEQETVFNRVKTRQCYQCKFCYHQIYPCAGTIFQKTRTPLISWFYVIYLFTASKNGISAYEVQRQIGGTYKTAWRMLKQIRVLAANDYFTLLGNFGVSCDESFVGGKNINRHRDKKVKNSQGRSFKDKTPVFGIFDKETKKVKLYVVPDTKRETLEPIIKEQIPFGSNIQTDEWMAYSRLSEDYNHDFIDHSKKQYAKEDVSTNDLENFWSNMKRTIKGSYIHVSRKYLQLYASETAFRFNNRESDKPIFDCLLDLI